MNNENNNGVLALSIKKHKEWIIVDIPDGRQIKILVRDHVSKNKNLCNVIVICPKDLKIQREINDSIGNHG